MKLSDILLVFVLAIISGFSVFWVQDLQARSADANGVAMVIYQNELILEVSLGSEEYRIVKPEHVLQINQTEGTFTVTGTLGPVVLQRENQMIRVISQTSPENICEIQGSTNSPLKPLTCLPNELIVRIERAMDESDEDAILS